MPNRLQRKHFRAPLPPGSKLVARPSRFGNRFDWRVYGKAEAVRLFVDTYEHDAAYRALVQRELAGYHLVCYCNLDEPCHADVQLRWANPVCAAAPSHN